MSPSSSAPTKRKRPPGNDIETLGRVLKDRLVALGICISDSWGGLEKIAAKDSIEIAKLGIPFYVLANKRSPVYQHLEEEGSVRLVPIDYRPRDFLDLRMRKDLKKLIETHRVNLIHCHQTSILSSVVPWVFNHRQLVLIASRHIMNNHSKRNPYHAAIYGRLDALVVMSIALKQNVLTTHSLRERQVKVIHYGLDFEQFDPERVNGSERRKQWGVDPDTIAIGLVGRVDPAKGQATFIRAAAGLTKDLVTSSGPLKMKFIIVGEETRGRASGYLDHLREIVREFRIEPYVHFAGYQEDIPEVMKALDIFVMPSRQEAFGLVAIEAMSMGCPAIISRGGSSEEIVGPNEEQGLLVRPDDAFDLQRQIRYLIDHSDERKALAKRGCEHVREVHDRRVRLQKTLELYERSLRRRGM